MDGMIFLRGAFYDPSVKTIKMIISTSTTDMNIVKFTKMEEVDEYLRKNNYDNFIIFKIYHSSDTGEVEVYCMPKMKKK
jgi:hypothetical protein